MSPLPNFLIIGAARSGTTTLHYLLQQHPQIDMSRTKEPNHFAFQDGWLDVPWPVQEEAVHAMIERSSLDHDAYRAQFAHAAPGQRVGDASPSYLPSAGAARRIRDALGRVKLIAVLRDPVSRAHSHYLQHVKSRGEEPARDFLAVLDAEQHELQAGRPATMALPYVQGGLYHAQLTRYLEHFPREDLQIHLFEDLEADPNGVLASIARFLEVDPNVPFATDVHYNASGRPRYPWVEGIVGRAPWLTRGLRATLPRAAVARLSAIRARMQQRTPSGGTSLDDATRARIAERYFAEDTRRLQDLIDRDLRAWLPPS